jgi:poly-gamma-glutamate capsule biosynthesis protein CapA/YwtB (metallophosphatase superfamily)
MKYQRVHNLFLLAMAAIAFLPSYGFCEDDVIKSSLTVISRPSIQSSPGIEISTETVTIKIKAVGDVMIGSTFPKPMLPPENGIHIFDQVKSRLSGADLLIGNLEGAFTKTNKCSKKNVDNIGCFAFRMPMEYINYLKDAGFKVMNVANNHARDFRDQGLADTIEHLRANDMGYVGPQDEYEVLTVNGVDIGVAGFYWNGLFNDMTDEVHTGEFLSKLKEQVDVLVVFFHGGAEGDKALHTQDVTEKFLGGARGNVVKFAHKAIDSGADIVIGSGPHVVRAMENYKGHLIAYSLGNFVGYELFNMAGPRKDSLILEADLDSTGAYISGKIIPVILSDKGEPRLDEKSSSISLIRKLTREDFPDSDISILDDGSIVLEAENEEQNKR